MSDGTKIEWTDATWNVADGCTRVSEGCRHCYAEGMAGRFWGERKFSDVRTHPVRLNEPFAWKNGRRIFVDSMGDLFHPDVPDEFIYRVWWVMGMCAMVPERRREHTFQILTKRPERMRDWLSKWADLEQRERWCREAGQVFDWADGPKYWPAALPNVWLGVSVERPEEDERVVPLLQTPAAVRFVSIEPMLGNVDLSRDGYSWLTCDGSDLTGDPNDFCCMQFAVGGKEHYHGVDWVIAGGENGQGARPVHPGWVRAVRRQCRRAGVPFFFKGWGEWAADDQVARYSAKESSRLAVHTFADGQIVRRWGRGKTGHLLDGEVWQEWPSVAN
jgi:protein gp37